MGACNSSCVERPRGYADAQVDRDPRPTCGFDGLAWLHPTSLDKTGSWYQGEAVGVSGGLRRRSAVPQHCSGTHVVAVAG